MELNFLNALLAAIEDCRAQDRQVRAVKFERGGVMGADSFWDGPLVDGPNGTRAEVPPSGVNSGWSSGHSKFADSIMKDEVGL